MPPGHSEAIIISEPERTTKKLNIYLARGNTIDDCILQPADGLWLWLAFDAGFHGRGLYAFHTVEYVM
jgi:hypothetical protein